jgi:putative ABC transport system permease protein
MRGELLRPIFLLAMRSGWNRRFTLALIIFSIAISTSLLLTIDRLRSDLRESFSHSVSGTDLVVGARTSPSSLMLYAIFRVGGATNNIRYSDIAYLLQNHDVAWVIPISLGDSLAGFPVLATDHNYFDHFQYGDHHALAFDQGRPFASSLDGVYEAVIGADVARRLDYRIGQRITLSHGAGPIPGSEHADKPFTVVGIFKRTGTPVDRTVHISLEGMQAIHIDWVAGVPIAGARISAEQARHMDLAPKEITAALVGLKNRIGVFSVQRQINDFPGEPLLAVLPGIALDELWDVMSAGEAALYLTSIFVAIVSLFGLIAVVLAGLNERRREIAILRSIGASARHILLLVLIEGAVITVVGAGIGSVVTIALIALAAPIIQSHFGVGLTLSAPDASQWELLLAVIGSGLFAGLLPASRAYALSLADGLSPRT